MSTRRPFTNEEKVMIALGIVPEGANITYRANDRKYYYYYLYEKGSWWCYYKEDFSGDCTGVNAQSQKVITNDFLGRTHSVHIG